MKRLNSVFEMDWKPRVVVEASAGTGKTYTIVGIYIRLLIEKKLDVDRILVMTFTNKATSELRGRILQRLRECAKAIETGEDGGDPFLAELINSVSEPERKGAMETVRTAIRNFDDSRIFTIHGFCQRVLSEDALHAGVPFDMEIIQHDSLLTEAAEDFWRNFMDRNGDSEAGALEIGKLMSYGKSPRELIGRDGLQSLFNARDANIEASPHPEPGKVFEEAARLRNGMRQEWIAHQAEIEKELLESDLSGFTPKNVSSRVREMKNFLADEKLKDDSFKQLKYFTADYVHDESNLKKGKTKFPAELPFFDLCSRYAALSDDLKSAETALVLSAYRDILNRRSEKSSQTGTMTYDDLLSKLMGALQDTERGPILAKKLLKSYPYALVDEFQDTDAVQYSIFDSIYPKSGEDSGLFMIGDPKQAIYAFRGADVYTYFEARGDGDPESWSLSRNFRSSPKLIEAVNHLFESDDRHSFIDREIEYLPSDAGHPGRGKEYLHNGNVAVPLRFIVKPGIETNKNDIKRAIYNETAVQTARLLGDSGITIRDDESGEMRRVEPGDIAILVNSHRDAVQIKKRLKDAGIDSVTYSQEKVFDTFEAKRLELVMNAVLNPFDRTHVNNALLSGLFGPDLDRLTKYSEDENLRQQLMDELQMLHDMWLDKGFMAMYRALFFKKDRITGIAGWKDAERILMNLNQLADLTASAETQENLDPNALHSWFLKEMVNPNKSDEQSLLLESDRNLVKISTIHGSKGLEFPLVICPTLWEGREFKENFIRYHKENSGELTLNIDRLETEERAEAERIGQIESIAEEVRKMYVALTRAKYECRVIWATHNQSHLSGLGAALLGRDQLLAKAGSKLREDDPNLSEELLLNPIRILADNHPELIRLDPFIEEVSAGLQAGEAVQSQPEPVKREYTGRSELRVHRRIESFSSLAGHHTETSEPDYDQVTGWYVDALSRTDIKPIERSIFTFPRGPVAGTAIHKLFEHDDFRFNTALEDNHSEWIGDVLDEYGIDGEWLPVVQKMMYNTVGAEYKDLILSSVQPSDELREMEFNFPVMKPDADELYRIIRGEPVSQLKGNEIRQYMTGFIDLIVRQNGRYYILDYKSNHLGDTPEDYDSESIQHEMKQAGYDLQYHLYTVALVRFLQRRIPDFSYDQHVGGAFYLFVRGMEKGSSHAVFHDKPSVDVIHKLEEALGRR